MSGSHRWHAERAALAVSQITEAITVKPMSRMELSEALDYHSSRLAHYIRRMHKGGQIHIVKWLKRPCGHGSFMAVFAPGPGKDAPKPKPKTAAQIAKDVRRKIKADPVRRVDYLQKQRARETRRGRKVVKADPIISMFAGLFGERRAA